MKNVTERQLKNRLIFTVVLGMLFFSVNAIAQDSAYYRSNTTTTTITTTESEDYNNPNQQTPTYEADVVETRDRRTAAAPRGGIKGGLNISNLIVENVTDRNARLGWHAGVYGQLFSSSAFAIQPEVNFSTKGNRIVRNSGVIDQETKFNLSYIDIPVLMVFKLGRAAEIHAGAYWAYLIGANIDSDGDLGSDFRNLGRDNFKSWDYGLAGGIGINLGEGAQLGARYNYGLNEIANSAGTRTWLGNAKNSFAQIYLAFNFAAGD